MSAPIILCASISATWAPGINRAAEILRDHHPGADDATVLELLILHGVFDVIDRQNNGRRVRSKSDDLLIAATEEAL